METNPQIELAFDFLQYTGTNVFLTGKAGTGKTTFLRTLKAMSPKRMIVVAPTGVAAINAGGVTIHSFFQLPFGPYIVGASAEGGEQKGMTNKYSREKINIIKSLDLLVIDEISMVRADLLDAVSDVLCRFRDRTKPFGGVQLLMIGDLQQLAPVVKDEEWLLLKEHYPSVFFFHSKALRETSYVSIELTQVYRQSDRMFIDLLNRIRDNKVDALTLNTLNRRYVRDFNPGDNEGYITLTTHNYQSQQINSRKLEEIASKSYTYTAEIKGEFPDFSYPTEEKLELKKGAQVMFVKNDSSSEKLYFNGKIGVVTALSQEYIVVKCNEKEDPILVVPEEWCNTKYTINSETKEITEEVLGTFKQYPLKTAWAITIHKSQGLTFEHAIIDAGAAFSHGQVYVALSRCKTLDGLVLSSPLTGNAVISDNEVQSFTRQVERNQPGTEQLQEAQRIYYLELLIELFDFTAMWRKLGQVAKLFNEHLLLLYPDLVKQYEVAQDNCLTELKEVGERFRIQLERLIVNGYRENEPLKDRITKGVTYFSEKVNVLTEQLLDKTDPEIDNKEIRKTIEEALERLRQDVDVKAATLTASMEGFDVKTYLETKAKALLNESRVHLRQKPAEPVKLKPTEISEDILNPELYDMLREWRKEEAERFKMPVFTVLHQKALLAIVNTLPTSKKELASLPGIGKKALERYGAKLLELVDAYRFKN